MNRMDLTFSAILENEPFARTVAASFITQLNPTMDELIEVKTIVSEAVSNAIIHGYELDETKFVHLSMTSDENREIEITVTDHGIGIEDIKQARQPMFTTKAHLERTGMGMTIMESFSDFFAIESARGVGTKIILKKRLKAVVEKAV